jgi:hypothetical protein
MSKAVNGQASTISRQQKKHLFSEMLFLTIETIT